MTAILHSLLSVGIIKFEYRTNISGHIRGLWSATFFCLPFNLRCLTVNCDAVNAQHSNYLQVCQVITVITLILNFFFMKYCTWISHLLFNILWWWFVESCDHFKINCISIKHFVMNLPDLILCDLQIEDERRRKW